MSMVAPVLLLPHRRLEPARGPGRRCECKLSVTFGVVVG